MDFDTWFARLVELNRRDDRYDKLEPSDCQDYFDDGYPPEHAWSEDGSYD